MTWVRVKQFTQRRARLVLFAIGDLHAREVQQRILVPGLDADRVGERMASVSS